MNEYRKSIPLATGTPYWFVDMGPIPDKPVWHQQLYAYGSYAFPTPEAATRFAVTHKSTDPGRSVGVRHPDGTVETL
jgi:hypothetical protein